MKTGTILALALAACGKADSKPPPEGKARPRDPLLAVALPAGATRVDGNQFRVDAAALPGCAAGADCAVLADLTSAGDFKVNPDYPFKFVAAAGAPPAAATFGLTGVHTGRLVLRFRRESAEPVRIAGDFKLSVCTLDQCLIEVAPLAVVIP